MTPERRKQTIYVDFVDSPDDGGWYIKETQSEAPYLSRTSADVYPTEGKAASVYSTGKVRWETWS